jgi:hypothetical protein
MKNQDTEQVETLLEVRILSRRASSLPKIAERRLTNDGSSFRRYLLRHVNVID